MFQIIEVNTLLLIAISNRSTCGSLLNTYRRSKGQLFKLKLYATGRTYIDRLHFIGTTSTYYALDAIRLAIKETKKGNDVERYLELKRCLSQMLPPDDPEGVPDLGWADSKSKQLRAEGEKLEQQLKGYKNNLIKESIRVCLYYLNVFVL